MKTRTRLFVVLLILVPIGFYWMVKWVLDDLRPRYLATMEESMVDMATLLASSISTDRPLNSDSCAPLRAMYDEAGRRQFRAHVYEMTKTNLALRVYVTDANGTVLFDSDNGREEGHDFSGWNDVIRTLRGEYGARSTRTDPEDSRTSVLHVAAPVRREDDIVGVLTVCKPADSVTLFLTMARRKVMMGGVLATLAVAVLAAAATVWITLPIERLTRYARDVRDGVRRPLPRTGHTELGMMGRALEEMREALEGRKYVEKYVQALTHEIKSPLSAIRGAAELMQEDMPNEQRRRFLGNIRTEADRIQDVVERLLHLAAIENRSAVRDVELIDLTELAREIVRDAEPQLSLRGISVSVAAGDGAEVRGERFLVRQALVNLLQNAIDFCPAEGAIRIAVRPEEDGVLVAVDDDGPGIPDYALERAFERFYSLPRPDTGKKSTGLGLPFVRGSATLHGGWARLETRDEGGTRAMLFLPRSPISPA